MTLTPVETQPRALEDYRGIAPDRILDEARALGDRLRGARLLHVNATAYGGGVAEMLHTLVPLLRDVGVHAEWRVIDADDAFFRVTKRMHNGLQGEDVSFSDEDRRLYVETVRENARRMSTDHDVIVVHDPQPAPLRALVEDPGRARWVWRAHIDTSHAAPGAWDLLRPFVAPYDAAMYSMPEFVPHDNPARRVEIVPPAIDPLRAKNVPPPPERRAEALAKLGLDPERPLVVQVSRFDPWKDPLGVVESWRRARGRVPGLQLVMAGSTARDDPQSREIHQEVARETAGERDAHVLTDLSDEDVSALQGYADVVMQKSLREGFGLTVAEAIWKGTPVVASAVGGIRAQVRDGAGGILVSSVDEAADAVVRLVTYPEEAARLAEAGRAVVREEFLMPRLLRDYLALMASLTSGGAGSSPARRP